VAHGAITGAIHLARGSVDVVVAFVDDDAVTTVSVSVK
jgi:hypothetical protein